MTKKKQEELVTDEQKMLIMRHYLDHVWQHSCELIETLEDHPRPAGIALFAMLMIAEHEGKEDMEETEEIILQIADMVRSKNTTKANVIKLAAVPKKKKKKVTKAKKKLK